MSAQNPAPVKRIGVPDIRARKGGEPLVCLTAYDAPTARLLDPHCDVLLVGDSLGMVVHGLANTIPVTLDMMILHGQAVMRGANRAMVVIDMPFGSYEASPGQAFDNAARILRETGAQAVKVESGVYIADTVRFLAERGVPVMAHVGLRPQAALAEGGFKAKGRSDAERTRVLDEARAADEAGAFAIVVEGVAEDLASQVTQAVKAPTIGIGASAECDGQILVTPDMLGLFDWTPRFVKRYADLKALTEDAVRAYAEDVRARRFPGPDEVYRITGA
ncbi:MAG: 3-methyl-2-oxobutanoate hydroxymethyltransferase PanB [Oceanicaulis sp. HLUCCA04]|nr:MAG: 3-methyl-2-oxobutanoate hydroxymethyltransferase PanB [Oceanicaulis sp. HLUCCA04]